MRLVLPAFICRGQPVSACCRAIPSWLSGRALNWTNSYLEPKELTVTESQTLAIEEGSEEKDVGDVLTVLGAEGKK